MFTILLAESVKEDLKGLRVVDRRKILDAVERQLQGEPGTETRHRKILVGLVPPFDAVPPVWQLSVGEFRVFSRAGRTRKGGVRPGDSQEDAAQDHEGDPVKTIAVRDLQKKVRECVDLSQTEEVVITRHGQPAAIVIGVEGKDWEEVLLQRSSSFWKLIEARRKEKTLTLAEMRKRVGVRRAPRKSKR